MQKEIEPTYYVDRSYYSSEITTISMPGSDSMGGSCSSGCSAPTSSAYLRVELSEERIGLRLPGGTPGLAST